MVISHCKSWRKLQSYFLHNFKSYLVAARLGSCVPNLDSEKIYTFFPAMFFVTLRLRTSLTLVSQLSLQSLSYYRYHTAQN